MMLVARLFIKFNAPSVKKKSTTTAGGGPQVVLALQTLSGSATAAPPIVVVIKGKGSLGIGFEEEGRDGGLEVVSPDSLIGKSGVTTEHRLAMVGDVAVTGMSGKEIATQLGKAQRPFSMTFVLNKN